MRSKFLALFVAINLVIIVIVGLPFSFMNHAASSACPFAMAFGGDCPSSEGMMAILTHHISGFRNAMYYAAGSSLASLAFLTLIFFGALFSKALLGLAVRERRFLAYVLQLFDNAAAAHLGKFRSWFLASRGKCDAKIIFRARGVVIS